MASEVIQLPTAQDANGRRASRESRVSHHIRQAVELSYPVYTFSELKRLLRCEYHRLVTDLRSTRSWGEISLITGMTRAGLNKLGDELPPRTTHNGVRALLAILQEVGGAGVTLPRLAGAYYERCPDLEEGPSFEEALRALVDSGEVVVRDGRYMAASHALVTDVTLADQIEETVAEIVERVRAQGDNAGPQLHRISFRAPADPEKQLDILYAIKQAVCRVAVETEEALSGDEQWMTIVLAGAPDLL